LETKPWLDELDVFIEKQVAADKFSGCVLIAQREKLIFKKAYGFASKRFKVSNQTDTKFNLGSINKVFTKVAILQLAERQKLSLGDYISEHLPAYPSSVANKVTINHLLTHTSGMGNYFNDKFEASKDKLRTVDDFMNLFLNDPLSFEPGEKMQYSNAGYVVLGKIIESISGQDYYEYVRQHIYKPAGMTDSDHYETDLPVPNVAIGYTSLYDEHDRRIKDSWRENTFIIGLKGSPAGGGYSTVDDMLKFSIALHDHKLLNQKYTELLYSPPAVASSTSQAQKPRMFRQMGGAPGIGTAFQMYLNSGVVEVILSNHDAQDMEAIHQKIESTLLDHHQ